MNIFTNYFKLYAKKYDFYPSAYPILEHVVTLVIKLKIDDNVFTILYIYIHILFLKKSLNGI